MTAGRPEALARVAARVREELARMENVVAAMEEVAGYGDEPDRVHVHWAGASAIELRVPIELEDLALSVYAALGLRPDGDIFALPIALGVRHAGMRAQVDDDWRIMDRLDKPMRARPVLSAELQARLEGLRRAWKAPDRSTVARWLLVAGARSIGV